MSEIEFRSSQLADVNYPKRLIELVVMPYESEAEEAEVRGRAVTEIVSRGAFNGVEKRTSQVKVNRGHQLDRVVGRAVALHPSRVEGLVAELRISRTDLGEETLILAEDGLLDASAGFALMRKHGRTGPVIPDAEVWENRNRRRLNHLFLDHIAMVPDPAYQDARVLTVRAHHNAPEPPETVEGKPNFDRLRLDELRAQMAVLDNRYSVGR
jgi:phage head maturation protease